MDTNLIKKERRKVRFLLMSISSKKARERKEIKTNRVQPGYYNGREVIK